MGGSGPLVAPLFTRRVTTVFDDNADDSCCLNDVPYTTTCDLSCLVTDSARSWQCGGSGGVRVPP